ncbi:MAG: preprotein translocase subunit SecA [Myxococcales bacterium]|nr:preprotein translocase subunit SecA [Myxococcales bacterium]
MAAWWNAFIPTKNERELSRLQAKLAQINDFESSLKALPDHALAAKTNEFKERFERAYAEAGGDPKRTVTEGTPESVKADRKLVDIALNPIMAEAFAVVREAARRTVGMRHFDVQMIGGMVLNEGKIAEMKTGEGKTLVATLPVYLNALAGRGSHVVTVNEYLASRDAEWMGQIYNFLGMGVGAIVHGVSDIERKRAYIEPITYGTNSEFGFDYLRDNMKLSLDEYVQRGLHFAIVDEVDSILIDEARTPLIISGPSEESTEKYGRINTIIPGLKREEDYTIDEKSRSVVLTERGIHSVEERLGIDNLYNPEHIEILHHVNQGLRAHTVFKRDIDYMIDQGKVKIIDEFTGRVMDGRRWSDGLHQAIEAKEGVKIENENQTLATITYQNYFRMFLKLAGMTGTAETEAEEFSKIYSLDVVVVPTNKPIARDDNHDLVYRTEMEKFQAIAEEIQDRTTNGQPVLVGTTSVEKSEVLSRHLKRLKINHNVLNAKYHEREAEIVAQAGAQGSVTIATNMAGRGTDILLGGNPEFLCRQEVDPEENESLYLQTLEKYKKDCEEQKQQVLDAGGLHILGTERHESRRIDNQLRGRAGRQGDPGSSVFYLSLEDDLMRIFGGERIQNLMTRMGMQEGEVIEHPWVNRSIENAQKRVEGHNFDIRKNLLEYDDVMNEQRKSLYKLRRDVIGASPENMREMVYDLCEDAIINMVTRTCPEKSHVEDWNLDSLEEIFHEQFDLRLELRNLTDVTHEELENQLFAEVEKGIAQKIELYQEEPFFTISRIIYLQTIDNLWKDHLREMDHLREGISLRGYAQKDPKQEYKKEGFNLFANMMAAIGGDVLQKAFRVVITHTTEEDYQARLEARRQREAQQMRMGSPAKEKQKTVRRSDKKVGRNDPCPCGSGKKFKKCCGLSNDLHP